MHLANCSRRFSDSFFIAKPPPDLAEVVNHTAFLRKNREANNCNAAIFTDLLIDIDTIKNHKSGIFSDWDTPATLAMGKDKTDEVAAFMQGLCPDEARESLANCGMYQCALQIPLMAQTYSPTPGVALSKAKIMRYINDDALTLQIWPAHKVALRTGEGFDKGDFTSITPEEIRIAMIGNVARRLRGEGLTDDELWTIRTNMYCVSVTFIIVDSEEQRFFKAVSCRREAQKAEAVCRRSCSPVIEAYISQYFCSPQPQLLHLYNPRRKSDKMRFCALPQ